MHNNYTLKFIHDDPDFIVIEKPCGYRTHKVSDQQLGFVETLEYHLGFKLWVTHRLDKETSGLMIFAKNKESATIFFELFENHKVQKTYHYVSDIKKPVAEHSVTSFIEKNDHIYIQNTNNKANADTVITYVSSLDDKAFVYKAQPKTGKSHQIRLHAELLGTPLLGDSEHGGNPYFRLMLHATELKFSFKNKDFHFTSSLPFSFTQFHLSQDYLNIVEGYQQFHKIYNHVDNQSYRIIHSSKNEIQADVYNDVLWVYWYKKDIPSELDIQALSAAAEKINLKWVCRHMTNRGHGVSHESQKNLWFYSCLNESWITEENDVKAEMRLHAGYSPGLFLDQRENRLWVKKNSEDKFVLNLFSYTSLFSVNAALGKAAKVTTVDASSNFINWSKNNFNINSLSADHHEFFVQDSLLFLEGSKKRQRTWDLIICDPPSFGRTKTTVWKIDKDLPRLAELMWACLNKNGSILFTCNYEKWTLKDSLNQFTKKIPKGNYTVEILPCPGLDFDPLDEFSNLTKGFIITKK